MAPNGNYTLTFKFGASDTGLLSHAKFTLESQNAALGSSLTCGGGSFSCSSYTPADLTYTVPVTNNMIYFALRKLDDTSPFTF